MKLGLKMTILALCAFGAVHGIETIELQPAPENTSGSVQGVDKRPIGLVVALLHDGVGFFKDSLLREERLRFRFQLALGAGMAVACAYAACERAGRL